VEEGEQQSWEIVDIDKIPSPEMIPVNPTLILEEIQQLESKAMKATTPVATQDP
jgi:hypothetical protein